MHGAFFKFFNKLEDKKCPLKDYFRARLTWRYLACETLGDYHDVYLKSDVLLLADFFEKFRKSCIKNYDLDAAHYFSAPGLAWDAALKMTKIN